MLRPAQRRLVLLTTAFALSLLSCGREVTGPENGITIGRRIGNIAIAPQMPTLMQVVEGAGDAVPFTKVRVVLRNEDGSIAKDTMVDFPSDADEISLSLQIPIPLTAPDSGLALSLTMAYVNAAGDTVFRGGPNAIVARPVGSSGANVPVDIPVTYEGTGSNASRVAIVPKTGTGVAGTTRSFSGSAFDAQDVVIPNTPFVFFSTDTSRAKVNAATGVATWQPVRGLARIVAALPNGNRADTATFLISLPASKLVLGSGDAQTGAVNGPLADSIVLRTLASDDVPVAGVIVNFAVATGGGSLLTSVDTSDANGNVSTKWTLGATLGAQTITATSAGLTGSPFTVSATGVAGIASRLEIASQPSSAIAGTSLAPAIVVQARDAFGNLATNFTGNVSIAITGAQAPALGGTAVRAAVAGVATFNDLSINPVGNYTLEVTSAALTPDTTANIAITPAAAAVLEFVSQPAGAVAGAAFVPPVTVRARDAFGNVDTAFTGTVAVSLLNGGGAVLSGSTSQAAVNGLATFSSLSVNLVGSTYSLQASSGALTPDTSSVFGITPSAPTQIALVSGGAQTGVVGAALAQPIVVEVRDAQGNLVPGATVDFSIVTGGGSAVPPSAATNANGQASTAWALGSALGAQELRASLAVAPAVFVAVPATATAGAPAQVVVTQAPTAAVAGAAFAPVVIAEVRDANGNVATSFGGDVTLTLGSAPPTGALLGTTTVTAVNGVATFGALNAQKAGAGYTLVASAAGFNSLPSAAFAVAPSAPAQFGIVDGNNQTGVAGGAFPSPLRVYVRDQFGNPIAGAVTSWNAQGVVTLAQTSVLSDADGIAANTATMGAAPGVQSTGPTVTTPGVDTTVIFTHTVTAGAAAQVVITQAPTTGVAGAALPPLFAEVRDALGNLVPTYTGLVVATLSTNPTGTVLGGTLSVNAVGGVATFSNLIVNSASAGYRLRARLDVEGYESAESDAFEVGAAAAASIAFVSGQIQSGTAGTLMSDSIIVEVRDAFNNPVAGQPVTFAPLAGASSVSQTAVVTNAQGRAAIRANFANTVGNPLPGVRATTPGVATVLETTVSITAAAGTQLAVTSAPFSTVVAGVPFSITAQVRDAFGNADLVFTDSVSIAILSGPAGATLSGSTRLPAVAGIREFAALSLDLAGSYELVVSATGLTSANTFSFTVTHADPASVTLVSGNAQSGAVSTTLPLPLEVDVRDAFNNPVPGASVLWAVTTSTATVGSTEVSTDANGRASTTLLLSTVPGPAEVSASVLALTPVVFNATAVAGAAVTPVELVAPAGATAGTALGSFSFAVEDQFGNLATSYNGVATVTLQEASAGQPAPVIISGDTALVVNGVATWNSLIVASAGDYQIVADFGGTLGTVVTGAITITPSTPSALTLDAGDAQSGAASTALLAPLSVRLADVYNNAIPGATIDWSVVSGLVTLSGPTSVTDAAGIASNTLLLGPTAGAFSIRAVNAAANDTVLFNGTITAGAPTQLILTAQSNSLTAGAADGSYSLEARDSFGNVATDFTGPVTVEIVSGPVSTFASGTLSPSATLGAVTFSDLVLNISGGYELRFFTAFDTVVTDPVVVTAAAAAALEVSIEPSNTVAGVGVGTIQVVARDAFGNSATAAGDSVFVSILTGPGGNPLTGTLRRQMSTGTAEFNDLGLTTAGDYSLQFDAPGLTSDTTQTFSVSPSTATTMLLTSGDGQTAAVLATIDSLVVRVEDAYGNGVGGQTVSWSVTGGSATLSATTSVSASNGEAWIFPTLGSIPEVNTFAATVVGLTNSPISFSATAVAGAPVRLLIQSTVAGGVAGVLAPITVEALDAQGNVALPFAGEVRARIVTGPVGAPIFGDSVLTASGGTVTFSNLQALIAGGYTLEFVATGLVPDTSNAFTITPGIASSTVRVGGDGQTVAAGASLATPLQVRVEDQYGNGIAGALVDWTVTSGTLGLLVSETTTDANGIATAEPDVLQAAGVVTLEAQGPIGAPVAFTLTIEPGAAAQLAVVAQPVGNTAAATLAAIEVEARDAFGNRVTTFTDSVTLSFEQLPAFASLTGTARVAAAAGVATFNDISLGRAGTYRFRFATTVPVADTTSDAFVITAGAAALVQAGRGDAQSVALFTTADTLGAQVIDASGNPVSGATVSWSVPAGIDSLGATTITDVDGYAFLVVQSDSLAGDFTPTATSAGLTGSPVQFTLTVLAGPAHMLRVVSAPDTVESSIAGPDWIVEVTDSVGNRITGATDNVTVSVNDGPASFTGTATVAAVAGVATFSDLLFSTAGNYTMEFTSTPLLSVTRSTVVSAGAAFAINIFSGAGQAAYATLPLESPVQVRVTDAAGNPVQGDSVVWSVLAGSGGGLVNGVEVDTVVTDANGVSSVSFTPGSTVGGQTIRAEASNTAIADIGFTVQALVGNRIWTGATDTEWSNGANWYGGIAPQQPEDSVVIGGSRPNYPALSSNVLISKLVVELGGQLAVGDNLLQVTGDLLAPQVTTFTVGASGSIRALGGGTHSIIGNFPVLRISTGTYNVTPQLGDQLFVLGDLIIDSNVLLVLSAGDTVVTNGNLITAGGGRVQQATGSLLSTQGFAEFGGGVSELNGGVLQVSGDFRTINAEPAAFRAAAAHETQIRGRNRTISFAFPDVSIDTSCSASCFGRLVVRSDQGADTVTFLSSVKARAGFNVDTRQIWADTVTLVAGAVSVLRADSARIETIGSFTDFHDFAGITVVDSAKFGGTGLLPPGLAVPTVVLGSRQIVGPHNANLIVEGTLDVGGGTAGINGTLVMRGAGRLRMTDNADTLSVGGAIDFSGGNTVGDLTNGVLRLAGDFHSAPSAFVAAPAHVTSFIGALGSTITLEGSGFAGGESRFGTVSLAKSSLATLTTASPLFIDGQLRTANLDQRLIGIGAAHIATARGADITRLFLQNQPLRIVDGAAVTRLDSLRFESFSDASQPQLYIERDSLEVSVVSPVFDSSATTPVYVELVDATVGPESLTVTVVDPLPAFHLGRITVGSRASLVGWNTFEFLTWTNGDGNREWSSPNNWSPPFPPFGGDSVVISGSTPPIITAPASVRSLVSTASAPIEINAVLVVSRVFSVGSSAGATCTGAGVLAKSTADSLVIDGAINCPLAVTAGITSLSAAATLDSLSIGGTGVVDPNGNTLTVSEVLRTSGSGTLAMNSGTDMVVVGAAAEFASTPSAGALTAGTLELRGSFSQITSPTAFQADSGHATVFAGIVNQRAAFANPDSSAAGSHFGRLVFAQDEGGVAVELDSDVFAVGVLSGSGLASTRAARAFGPATRTLTAAGANIYSDIDLNLDNVALRIVDATGAMDPLYSVRFSNMGDNVTQLEIHSIGGTVGLNFFEFDTTAVNTLYLRALDVDGAANGVLELAMSGTTPTFSFNRLSEDGGSIISGWPIEPSFFWTGDVSNVWTDVGNWSDGVVPGLGSFIEIPPTLNPPNGIPAGSYGGLEVTETSAAININGVVTFTGNVSAPLGIERGLACGSSDTLVVSPTFGAGLSGTIGCPVTITSGETGANNTLEVRSLTVTGGEFDVGEFTTTVANNFSTSGAGTLRMQIPTGALSVQGSATFGGGSTSGLLTAGTLTARSGFSVTSDSGFVASDDHRSVLGGNFILDFYTFALPATLGHRFGILEFAPQSLQHAVGPAHRIVTDSLFMPNGGTLLMDGSGDEVLVLGSVRTASNAGIDAVRLEVGGHYSYPGSTVIDTVVFSGLGQRLPFSSDTGVVHSFQNVMVEGTVQTLATAGDSLVVPSILSVIGAGSLRFGQDGGVQTTARIAILRTSQDGVVSMQNAGDSVFVSLDANFTGGSTAGLLTDGTLIVGSSLAQSSITSPEAFSASGNHLTIVRPETFTGLTFDAPGAGAGTSGFASLRFEPAFMDTVFFGSDVFVRGVLSDPPTDTLVLGSTSAAQHELVSWGADVDGLRFSQVNWRITGQSAFNGANNLLFTDQDSTVTQLELRGADASVSMSNVTFFVQPSTGLFLRLEDTNGGAPFTLNTSNWSPAYHGGQIDLVNGALLTGWAEFPAFTWVGGTSNDFDTPSNWLLGRIPGPGDSIVVTPGASNILSVTGTRSLGGLHLASGAALSVVDELIVAGGFTAELGTLSCVFGSNAIRVRNPSGTPRNLSFAGADCNIYVEEGEYELQGDSARARNVTVNGTGYLDLNNRRLETTDNFGTLNTGRIEMNDPADSLVVGGQAFFQGGSTADLITDGFIYVRNAFVQGGSTASAFRASGSNRAVIGDTLVAFGDSVEFSFSRPDSSWFNDVRVFNGPWTIDNALRARTLTTVGTATLTGGAIQTDSILTFSSGSTVALRNITTRGDFTPSDDFAVDTTVFMGSLTGPEQIIPPLSASDSYRVLRTMADVRYQQVSPLLRVSDRIQVDSGRFRVEGASGSESVSIAADTADLVVGPLGLFAMNTSGTVHVDSAHFGGQSSINELFAGTLRVDGYLAQRSTSSPNSFRPDSITVVLGDSVVVDFESPAQARFGDLVLADSARVTLRNSIIVDGELSRQSGPDGTHVFADVLSTAPPRTITVTGSMLFASGLTTTLHNVQLKLEDDFFGDFGGSYSFSGLTFTDMDPTSTYLDLTTFENYFIIPELISFSTPVTTGRYFEIPATTTLAFQNTTPAIGCIGAPEYCVGPRFEPNAGLQNVFSGINGANWGDAGNWSLGRVPTSYDDVTLVAGAVPFFNTGATRYVNNLSIDPSVSFFMDASELVVRGNLSVGVGAGIFGAAGSTLRMQPNPGIPVTLGGGGNIDDVALFISAPLMGSDSTVTLVGGGLDVGGTLTVEGGRLDVGGQTLQVGTLVTTISGRLSMLTATDSIYVIGNASFGGGSTDGQLTNGKLVVGGNLTQSSTPTAFAASGDHTTYLFGGANTLSFANPGADASHFRNLTLSTSGTLTFASDVFVNGTFLKDQISVTVTGGATNRLLQVGGLSNNGSSFPFDNVRVRLVDGGTLNLFNGVFLYNQDPTTDYLTIDRAGGSITFPQSSFDPQPTTGHYVVVRDTVANGDSLIVTLEDAGPAGHGGFIDSVGFARIAGWDAVGLYTFTGSVSGDVGNLANWDSPILPTSTSNVVFSNAVAADSVTLGNVSYREVTFATGAQVIINAPVTVARDLTFSSAPRCTPGGRFNLQSSGGIEFVSGSAPTCAVVMTSGAYTISDSAQFRSLTVGDGGQLLIIDDTLVVTDTLATVGTGRMQTNNAADVITVQGIARFTGTGGSAFLNGTVNVWSALEVGASLQATGARLVLGDPSAATTFTARTTGDLEFTFDSIFVRDGTLNILDSLVARRYIGTIGTGGSVITGGKLRVGDYDFGIDGNLDLGESGDLTVNRLEIYGTLGMVNSFNVDTTDFLGQLSGQQEIPAANSSSVAHNYGRVRVYSDAIMDQVPTGIPFAYTISDALEVLVGQLTIGDAVTQDTVYLSLGSGDLIVNGGGARLSMAYPARVVVDSVHLQSDSQSQFLSGRIVTRSFTARSFSDAFASVLASSGTHTVDFITGGSVYFEDTDRARLANVRWTGGAVTNFTSSMDVNTFGRVNQTDGIITLQADSSGEAHSIFAAGTDFGISNSGLVMSNMSLHLLAAYPGLYGDFTLNNVTFQQMNQVVPVDFLWVRFVGLNSETFSNINFDSPLSGSSTYFRFFDASPGSEITFVNASPNVDCLAGTCLPGNFAPSGVAQFVSWDGSEGSDWANPENWTPAIVPSASTDVEIPALTPIDPAIFGAATARSVNVLSGASLTFTSSDTLTLWGSLSVAGQLLGDNGTVRMRHSVGGATLAVQGEMRPRLAITAGLGGYTDTVSLAGPVNRPLSGLGAGTRIEAGMLNLGTYAYVDSGSFSTVGSGRIRMDESTAALTVGQLLSFGGGPTDGLLTNGTITVLGDFEEVGGAGAFRASPSHVTRFARPGAQSVTFASSGFGPSDSFFGDVELTSNDPTALLQLNSNLRATGQLRLTAFGAPNRIQGLGGNRFVQLRGAEFSDSLVLDAVKLRIDDGDVIGAMNGLRFVNLVENGLPALELARAGGTITMFGATFDLGPAFTNNFLVARDENTGDADVLTVDFGSTVTPIITGGRVLLQNGAQLLGWAEPAPEFSAVWTGFPGSSSNWNDPSNWQSGILPNASANVVINFGAHYPLIPDGTEINDLTVQANAAATIESGGVLTIYGDLSVSSLLVGGDAASRIVMRPHGSQNLFAVQDLQVPIEIATGLAGNLGVVTPTNATIENGLAGGDLTVTGSTLSIGGGTLIVQGSFSTQGAGRLLMNGAGSLNVFGDATFDGQQSNLTNGTLTVVGNLTQMATNSTSSLVSTGDHRVSFQGSFNSEVSFASSSPSLSRLGRVEIRKDDLFAQVQFVSASTYIERIADFFENDIAVGPLGPAHLYIINDINVGTNNGSLAFIGPSGFITFLGGEAACQFGLYQITISGDATAGDRISPLACFVPS